MSPLLTPAGLADVLGLAPRTIYNRISTGGDLPSCVRIGKLPRFSVDDVEQWLEQKRIHAPASLIGLERGLRPSGVERATQEAGQQ